jgi:hypothetical protein
MAPLEDCSVLVNEGERPLLQTECWAFLDPDLGPLTVPPVRSKHGHVGLDPKRIIPPMACRDHSSVKVEDPRQFGAIEGGDWAPVPASRERRDDTQALFTFG